MIEGWIQRRSGTGKDINGDKYRRLGTVMNIIELTAENIISFIDYIPVDVADYIGRIFYHGLVAAQDDVPVAAMVWELKNMLNEDPKVSNIVWLRTDDEQAAYEMLDQYEENILLDEVTRSTFSIAAKKDSLEQLVLKNVGFSVVLTEGDEISAGLWQVSDVPLMQKTDIDNSVMSLWSAGVNELSDSFRMFEEKGHHGICEDLMYLPRSHFENDVSCFYRQKGVISGLFLVHMMPTGSLRIELMIAAGKDPQMYILKMIKKALSTALEMYSLDMKIVIDRHNLSALALGERLFPYEIGIPVFQGSRNEPV